MGRALEVSTIKALSRQLKVYWIYDPQNDNFLTSRQVRDTKWEQRQQLKEDGSNIINTIIPAFSMNIFLRSSGEER